MKKFLTIFLFIILASGIFSITTQAMHKKDMAYKKQAITKGLRNYESTYNLKVLNQEYFCCDSNCYNLKTFGYNKKTNSYSVDMLLDLMNWDEHETYKSPHNDGFITYLIFKTELSADNKITVQFKGYATGYVVLEYENGKASSAHYNITAIHNDVPDIIKKRIPEFESLFLKWIDSDLYIRNIKTLADIS